MSFHIVQNDISKMNTDAIVNAANTQLQKGAGVCGAIFKGADDNRLQLECNKIGYCKTGDAVITGGYNLKSKYIIHAVGPIWRGGHFHEEELLRGAYRSSLNLAREYECESISVPLISSGIYGYPKEDVLRIAISEIENFLRENDMEIFLVVYDKKSFSISKEVFGDIKSYIDDKLITEDSRSLFMNMSISEYNDKSELCNDIIETNKFINEQCNAAICYQPNQKKIKSKKAFVSKAESESISKMSASGNKGLDDIVNKLDETFSEMLLRVIDEKGKTDTEVYKKANIDRKLFSKIRSNPSYNPKKITAIAFAIALELDLEETNDLLNKAGYALSHSNKFDIIIEYFIKNKIYNIYDINEALFAFDQVLLGA